MSMSTGDVRRSPSSKLTAKAAATDKPEADPTDADEIGIDADESDEAPEAATTKPGARGNGSGGPGGSGTGRTGAGGNARPAKNAGAAKSAGAARSGAKGASTAKSAAPAKSAAAAKTTTSSSAGRPGTAKVGGKIAEAKVTATKVTSAKATGVKVAGARPVGGPPGARGPIKAGGGKGRRPSGPIKVRQGANWGPIIMFTIAGLLAVSIIGYGAYQVFKTESKGPWQDRAAAIDGIHDYLKTNPEWFAIPAEGNHKAGVLTYPTSPPVGGIHNPVWQNCMGDVYTSEIAKEQATHSMEHGAVWIAYNPDLPKDQVDELAKKVNNQTFMLMSPYPGLDSKISLQTWGYQLKVADAGDSRIDAFIDALRVNATQEKEAGCSGGITDATPKPLDLPALPSGS